MNRSDACAPAAVAALFVLAACGAADEPAVGNCELLTNAEASELAGFELVAGTDTPLGCPFTRPGDLTAQVIVGSDALDEALRDRVERGYPQAADILAVDGSGDEGLAVLTPTGGTVAAIVTARGGRLVELSIFMLGIEPGDTSDIQDAAKYAALALDRATD
jgi:hypothetical protein